MAFILIFAGPGLIEIPAVMGVGTESLFGDGYGTSNHSGDGDRFIEVRQGVARQDRSCRQVPTTFAKRQAALGSRRVGSRFSQSAEIPERLRNCHARQGAEPVPAAAPSRVRPTAHLRRGRSASSERPSAGVASRANEKIFE